MFFFIDIGNYKYYPLKNISCKMWQFFMNFGSGDSSPVVVSKILSLIIFDDFFAYMPLEISNNHLINFYFVSN